METRRFTTDLNCGSCVAKVTPLLNAEKSIESWEVDIKDPRKILTVKGDYISPFLVRELVAQSGFQVLDELKSEPPTLAPAIQEALTTSKWTQYRPLILIFTFITATIALRQASAGEWDLHAAMNDFMAGFFLVFSFFKFLDLKKFADAYRTYDVVAARVPVYGLIYPFIELGLGIAYLTEWSPQAMHLTTLIVMSVSSIGVIQALREKRLIECACLGTVFNLPMTKVTLFEDLLMAAMALAMLLGWA